MTPPVRAGVARVPESAPEGARNRCGAASARNWRGRRGAGAGRRVGPSATSVNSEASNPASRTAGTRSDSCSSAPPPTSSPTPEQNLRPALRWPHPARERIRPCKDVSTLHAMLARAARAAAMRPAVTAGALSIGVSLAAAAAIARGGSLAAPPVLAVLVVAGVVLLLSFRPGNPLALVARARPLSAGVRQPRHDPAPSGPRALPGASPRLPALDADGT